MYRMQIAFTVWIVNNLDLKSSCVCRLCRRRRSRFAHCMRALLQFIWIYKFGSNFRSNIKHLLRPTVFTVTAYRSERSDIYSRTFVCDASIIVWTEYCELFIIKCQCCHLWKIVIFSCYIDCYGNIVNLQFDVSIIEKNNNLHNNTTKILHFILSKFTNILRLH